MDYNDKLRLAKEALDSGSYDKKTIEYIFPELAESEDERIRKWIRKELESKYVVDNIVNNVIADKALAWLEKQCQTFTQKDVDDAYLKGICDTKQELEKQGEQKHTDKVEPKFRTGDWVVCYSDIDRVKRVTDRFYHFESGDCGLIKNIDKDCHLWTIQDAKDGDVLYSTDSKQPFIYKERPQFGQAIGYCCINIFGEFAIWNTSKCVICTDKYIPATKEQRELLFQKMHEAGYEWNVEKKESKKIGQKPAEWSEEDNAFCNGIISHFEKVLEDGTLETECIDKQVVSDLRHCYKRNINWLKSLKDRVQPKQEWSALDERNLQGVIDEVQANKNNAPDYDLETYDRFLNWLKALKDRYTWKPSDEQLKSLQEVIDVGHFTSYPNSLETLYEQLKKLREE